MNTESLGYCCGVLCGRGYIKRGRNNCVGLQTKNQELANTFASSLRDICGFDINIYRKIDDEKTCFVVNVYNKNIVDVFDHLKLDTNKKNWFPPTQVDTDPDFRANFLAGFFDSTAFLYFNREKFLVSGSSYRYLRATSTSIRGLVKIHELLSMDGVESNFRAYKGKLGYLTIKGNWRLATFFTKVKLRTSKKNAVGKVLQD